MNNIQNLTVYGSVSESNGTTIYHISSAGRDKDNKHTVDIKGKLMEFQFQDGTTWICDAATMHEVFPETDSIALQPGKRGPDADTFELPQYLQPAESDRGIIGTIALKVLKVFAKKPAKDLVHKLALKLERAHLLNGMQSLQDNDQFVETYMEEGGQLFRVSKDFNFQAFGDKAPKKPYFLFIHGTNSDALGAFGDLRNTAVWTHLHDKYGQNIIAFQHRTLTVSPLQNAVRLAQLLPPGIDLHILSHSRGGIIGDILSLYSSKGDIPQAGFSNESLDVLAKEGDRENDISCIHELRKIFKKKKITVSKFIRVACPAAGTRLASRRLDNMLNVFFNLLKVIPGPVPDILKELVEAAVSSKDDIKVLPGLEAQNPDSPFMKILNDQSSKSAINGNSLAVISGNGTFSFSGSGLLVILGRLFYWQRNDLVVNTDSMYLGAKRANQIQYYFDQGSEVNHVDYFRNRSTREAIEEAIKAQENQLIPGFKLVPQDQVPDSDRGIAGLEHGELYPYADTPSGNKPIVVLLPGIMGSNLEKGKNRIWLNYIAIISGLDKLDQLDDPGIKATSIVRTSYRRLAERLKKKYDVVIFPFDWRKQLTESASLFNDRIKDLLTYEQPIKIIGHSMGGVLVRDFMIHHDSTWRQLNKHPDFRLIFLGAPLGGSHRILTVMFGQDGIIRKINMLDRKHSKKELVDIFTKLPGILGLLPLTTDKDFAKPATWEEMRNGFYDTSWPLPSTRSLNTFKTYRDNILHKRASIDYGRAYYIAGKDKSTPCDYTFDNLSTRKELLFLATAKGDQSVTWESGIPGEMDPKNVYYVNVTHGDLADAPEIFSGIEDLLEKGTTELLNHHPLNTREKETLFRHQEEIDFDFTEDGAARSILGKRTVTNKEETRMPMKVSVSNGDLRYSSFPILAGHFMNDGVLFAEKAIDQCLGGMLTAKHRLGLYPEQIEFNDVYESYNGYPGAIIVGLGEPGKLTTSQLTKTVQKGIANYLLSIQKKEIKDSNIGLSSLIIGCGFGGLSIESSTKAIIEGVNHANEMILDLYPLGETKTIQHIEFVEIYLDRAMSCMYQLKRIEREGNKTYNIRIAQKKIKNLLGLKKRLPLDATEDWWNRITIKFKQDSKSSAPSSMIFSVATTGARVEESELFSPTKLIDKFIDKASDKNLWSPQTAKTLFELMIPNELKEQLKRKANITWVVDEQTAAYPWELLQHDVINSKPICINAGMIRQLSTSHNQYRGKEIPGEKALVIADPLLDGFVNQLPGARAEGKTVERVLINSQFPCLSYINTEADVILEALMQDGGYSILHLAGHGIFNAENPHESGMVIGDGVYLTTNSIRQMPATPELAFVNCCFLGKVEGVDEKYYHDRFRLAANIGTQLIRNGVKAVIAAGWAIHDGAANEFAAIFYNAMIEGYSFGDAVKMARAAIYENYPADNTWGAYQCYGDHFYKLKKIVDRKSVWSPEYVVPEEAEIHLDNLLNQLETDQRTAVQVAEELNTIMKAVTARELDSPAIAEKEALIYLEIGDYDRAVDRFKKLLRKEKAEFSFLCTEKYCNARAKLSVRAFIEDAKINKTKLVTEIDSAIHDLSGLLAVGKTAERYNILGSSYKLRSFFAGNKDERIDAYKSAAFYYDQAFQRAGNENRVDSMCNVLELEYLLRLNGKQPGQGFRIHGESYKMKDLKEARQMLKAEREKVRDPQMDMDYWDMVASMNIMLCELFLNLAGSAGKIGWDDLRNGYIRLWEKAGSLQKKAAELEHLQFLTFALLSIYGSPAKNEFVAEDGFIPYSQDHLGAQIKLLRTAFQQSKN